MVRRGRARPTLTPIARAIAGAAGRGDRWGEPPAPSEIPEDRTLAAVMVLGQKDLAEAFLELTPAQATFLHKRLMTTSDVDARHLSGHVRPAKNPRGAGQTCSCYHQVEGWVDLREDTVHQWKRQPRFRRVYDTMLEAPLVYAQSRLEHLSSTASAVYQDLLTNPSVPHGVKRLAAKDILQMNGLAAPDGAHETENTVASSMMFIVARQRWERGLELNQAQRQLLLSGGVNPDHRPELVVRTLDGEDEIIPGTFREVDDAAAPAAVGADAGEVPAGADGGGSEVADEPANPWADLEPVAVEPGVEEDATERPVLSDVAASALPAAWR